jgi:uncharacterized protein (TIRG00374 family)
VKKRINVIIGLLISAIFVYLAFRRVELTEVIYSVQRVNYLWIIPNVAVVVMTMVIRAERWRHILRPLREYKMGQLFPPVMIGFMANNLLPVRLGEIVRAYSLGAKTGQSRSSIFATVVIERIFDSLSLMAMFWLVILFIPFPPVVRKFGFATLILNLILIIFLIVLKQKGEILIDKITSRIPFLPSPLANKIDHILRRFAEGLNIFEKYKSLGLIAVWSLILWVVTALSNYFIFMAFGFYPDIAASFILLLFVAAGVLLPSAPGFVGVFQAAVIGAFALLNNLGMIGYQLTVEKIRMLSLAIPAFSNAPVPAFGSYCESLGLFGISKGEALSFSMILWLCQYIPVTLLGLYYLKRQHLSLKVSDGK